MKVVNLEDHGELAMLALEVATTRHQVMLRKDGQDVAVIRPVESNDTERFVVEDGESPQQGILRFAGSFKGLVDEELLDEIYRSRTISTRNMPEF